MREVAVGDSSLSAEAATFAACVATILEVALEDVPQPVGDEEIARWRTSRWLGGLGLGLVEIADATSFSWAGPWIAWVRSPVDGERRAVVMFGVPSGVAWDPSGVTATGGWQLESGFVVAALDIALARPSLARSPTSIGAVEAIFIAPEAGAPARALDSVRALAARGLEDDRHTMGRGTFPSGVPGSAITLIEAEVCDSFAPPLDASEHRRNIVTRGTDLNSLVGHEFVVGMVQCRGTRLCEPCNVLQGYASRPVLRPLVHRGGLRADILQSGVLCVGDQVRVT